MRHYSLRFKVSILFGIVFLLVCILFIVSIALEITTRKQEQGARQEYIIHSLMNNYQNNSDIKLQDYFLNSGFMPIEDKTIIKNIKEKGEKTFQLSTQIGDFSSIYYNKLLYLHVKDKDLDLMLQANREQNTTFEFIVVGFLVSLGLTTLLYVSIINSLSPLQKLSFQVAQAASGKEFELENYNDDEIGKIAYEFSNTMHKNQELVESRQLFLRTIMHELKTPIGKGRIIAEMIKEEKQKERLIKVFERLNLLINEFAKIESLFSKNYNLNKAPHKFSQILEQAKIFLMQDDFDSKATVQIHADGIWLADIEIFALIIKNLIDNAIKYSDDGHCEIQSYKDHFLIINKGKSLKQDFQEYLKPFYREKDNVIEGMGLGLYIVDKTCNMHNFSLSYSYENSYHRFKISQNQA